MSLEVDRSSKAKTGKNSVFHMPITNTLGLEAQKARANMKNWALSAPEDYTAERNKVYMSVLEAMVEGNHDIIWSLLAEGKYNGEAHIKCKGDDWSPNLPDAQVAKLANGFAKSIMEAFDDIMSEVLPDDYKKLAEDKVRDINRVKGISDISA